MPFTNRYPYTDFHELNLDWFLEEFKKVTDKVTDLDTTVQQFTEFVTNYFDSLDVQQEISNEISRKIADGTIPGLLAPMVETVQQELDAQVAVQDNRLSVLEGRMDEFASLPPGSTAGNAELLDIRIEASGYTAASAGDAVRDQVGNLTEDLGTAVNNQNRRNKYLYKENTYIDNAGTESTLSGYDCYKVPVSQDTMISLVWNPATPFYSSLSDANVFKWHNSNNTVTPMGMLTPDRSYYIDKNNGFAMFIAPAGADYLIFHSNHARITTFTVEVNTPYSTVVSDDLVKASGFPRKISKDTAIYSKIYTGATDQLSSLSGTYYAMTMKVHTGDKIHFDTLVLSMYAYFRPLTDPAYDVRVQDFLVPEDGFIHVFVTNVMTENGSITPGSGQDISWGQIIDAPNNVNAFNGLQAVAFGTSLTYNANTTGGYLTKLRALSGMTIENQGIGSATIMNQILTNIRSYGGYATKNVVILEGFVNDWYINNPLGTYKDTTTATVCGCVRTALNYILAQNPNLTLFLILDHYGRQVGGSHCESTAVNGAGLTQFEYYEEIAKVAESLAIPVIKEYAVSQICENTPQYLLDNIHCNTLGADQSGYAIWSRMKDYYPNQQ